MLWTVASLAWQFVGDARHLVRESGGQRLNGLVLGFLPQPFVTREDGVDGRRAVTLSDSAERRRWFVHPVLQFGARLGQRVLFDGFDGPHSGRPRPLQSLVPSLGWAPPPSADWLRNRAPPWIKREKSTNRTAEPRPRVAAACRHVVESIVHCTSTLRESSPVPHARAGRCESACRPAARSLCAQYAFHMRRRRCFRVAGGQSAGLQNLCPGFFVCKQGRPSRARPCENDLVRPNGLRGRFPRRTLVRKFVPGAVLALLLGRAVRRRRG